MISTLLTLLIIGLILWVIYFIVGKFIGGTPHQIIGAVLAIIFLVYALQRLGLISGISL